MPRPGMSEIDRLLRAERAAHVAGQSAARWWKEITSATDSAVTPTALDTAFHDALGTVKEALDADTVALLLTNESGDELRARASTGLRDEVGMRIRAGEGMAGRVLASRRPLIVADLSEIQVASPALRDSGLRSVVAVPVLSGDHVLGVLHAGSFELDRFGPSDAEFLELLADRFAAALDRVRLFDQQARLAEMCSFFADTAKVVAEASDYSTALDRLASLALPALGDICLVDVVDEDGTIERMVAKHRDPERQALVARLHTDFPPDPSGTHPAVDVVRTGKTSWSPDMTLDFLRATTRDDDHLRLTQELGFRSYLAVPLASAGVILGSLTLVSCTRPFVADDVQFAERLAEQVAAVVARARRYDLSVHTSHLLQARLLPQRLPAIDGWALDTRYEAASQGLEVGGDFFDVTLLGPGRVGIMIGDVAGHDGAAAALMGQLRSAVRALSGQAASPAGLITALQANWDFLGFERIATAVFGELEPDRGTVTLASAGHHPPLLVEAGQASFLPVMPTAPLGAPAGPERSWTGTLGPGQVLVLYTDGAIEERALGIDAGRERLVAAAAAGPARPDAVCDRIIASLHADRADDVALLALGRRPHPT